MAARLETATFNIAIKSGQTVVVRDLEYSNGDTISFTVALPNDGGQTISDLHRASAEHVIALLQNWLAPKE